MSPCPESDTCLDYYKILRNGMPPKNTGHGPMREKWYAPPRSRTDEREMVCLPTWQDMALKPQARQDMDEVVDEAKHPHENGPRTGRD